MCVAVLLEKKDKTSKVVVYNKLSVILISLDTDKQYEC